MGACDTLDKLEALAPHMDLEQCGECGREQKSTPRSRAPQMVQVQKDPHFIHHASMPGGKKIPLLKTLLTARCERDCYYCPFRAGRDVRKPEFTPDELAAAFDRLHRKGAVEGIFLSSGIAGGGVRTQDGLIQTAEILRDRYEFQGYMHLKLMPGAEFAQIERSMQLADRVSMNLEAPTRESLARLAPHKRLLDELVRPLQDVERIRQSHGGTPGGWHNPMRSGPSQTTQFVVGPGGETDQEIMKTVGYLRNSVGLARTYFSAFTPVRGTPLENRAAESPVREHRLYQSDFLLRDYGFTVDELPFADDGNLSLADDPKLVWARTHLAEEPVEINTADRDRLLRVPGVGPVGAKRILDARREGSLRNVRDLRSLGVITKRAKPYILLGGRRPEYQLELFA